MSAVAEKTERRGFTAPKPDDPGRARDVVVGDVVYWYDGRPADCPPTPAVVTRVGVGTGLSLSLIDQQNVRLRTKDGAKHHADPTLREEEVVLNGTWEYHPRVRQVQNLEQRLTALIMELTPSPSKK